MSHRFASANTAGPVWGLFLGALMTFVGMGLWFNTTLAVMPERQEQSLAVASMLVGLFLAVYAGREVCRQRR
ncbi:hypothetical protein AAGS40_16655 [Paraburkholderia sp. PREW-6R]|uniref:hypothetical protein n=1 Tax=Paraburkholderia sp. PREW-6R TaxID=3141544 RepID=UPI0031F5BAB3